jgi:hypothetical protein
MIFPDEAHTTGIPETPMIARRGALGTLTMAGIGMFASGVPANAASPLKARSSSPRVTVPTSSGSAPAIPAMRYAAPRSPLAEVPREWAVVNGQLANQYLRYLSSFRMKRVNPEQVIAAHAKQKGGVWNTLPPKQWWNRMAYVLRVVDRIALEMGVNEVEVISAYRSPGYNSRCGGRTGSWHQANIAADVKFPVRASQVTRTARELRDLGLFKGGVGGYWNFTHIDARGQNINW